MTLAAREVIAEISRNWGAGWGRKKSTEYPILNIFNCIKFVSPFMNVTYPEGTLNSEKIECGHAGKGETQLLMGVAPELVNMEALQTLASEELPHWLRNSHAAVEKQGKFWIDLCINSWIEELTKNG